MEAGFGKAPTRTFDIGGPRLAGRGVHVVRFDRAFARFDCGKKVSVSRDVYYVNSQGNGQT